MKRIDALVTPSILKWARISMGFTTDAVAKKMRRSEIEIKSWESGGSKPSLAQARRLSELYKRPLAVFYLSKPPSGFTVLKDFRVLPSESTRIYSPQLSLLIRELQSKQEWLHNFFIFEDKAALDYVESATMETPYAQLAKIIRKKMDVSFNEQFESRSKKEFLKLLINKTEKLGIAVCQQGNIECTEARGLVLSDKYAPFIFINSNDAKSAQVFTIIHEIAHLWIGQSGISNIGETFLDKNFDKIEVYCNKIAADFLLDHNDFYQDWNINKNKLIDSIRKLSEKFKVSSEVVARRFLDNSYISHDKYLELRSLFQAEWKEYCKSKIDRYSKQKGFASPHLMKVINNGQLFTQIVLNAYQNSVITGREASSLLGTKINHFKKIFKYIIT